MSATLLIFPPVLRAGASGFLYAATFSVLTAVDPWVVRSGWRGNGAHHTHVFK